MRAYSCLCAYSRSRALSCPRALPRWRPALGLALALALVLSAALLAGCSLPQTQAAYDKQTLSVEFPDGSVKTISVGTLRSLPQHHLDASYLRSTGKRESYQMDGPALKDVLAQVGANLDDYAQVSVGGSDGYYTLLSRDIIKETKPDQLLLAVKVNGKKKLDRAVAPIWLTVQGQRGPYWVKMVNKIVLYQQEQKKDIKTVWVFSNLTHDVKPISYPYFGEKDEAVNLQEVWPLLDAVNWKSFFTMKSSDGYLRNESLRAVMKDYYIKTTGKDAPINVAPTIDPAFGVKNIAWCSTDADAMIFPGQLAKYLPAAGPAAGTGAGAAAGTGAAAAKSIALDAVLKEVGVTDIAHKKFVLEDIDGTPYFLLGSELNQVFLTTQGPPYGLSFGPGLAASAKISNLLDIREVSYDYTE